MSTSQTENYYRPYRDYAWRFRIWLVVFGVSAPIALLSRDKVYEAISASCVAKAAICMMFAGVFIQILLTWVYKWCMWTLYMAEIGQLKITDPRFLVANDLSTSFATEFILDLLTLMLFAASTVILLTVLL